LQKIIRKKFEQAAKIATIILFNSGDFRPAKYKT
jgi:hypothetical protein